MKRRHLKPLITILSILCLLIVISLAVVYFNINQSVTKGGIITKSSVVTFSCDSNYKNVYLTLEVNGTNISGIVNYYIVNPKGKILEKGEINEQDNSLKIVKKFQGQMGTWKIQFENLTDGEEIDYNLDEQGTNGFKNIHN